MEDFDNQFLVFVDESGDHGLQTIDPGFPAFVLAFCVVRKSSYARVWLPAITEFKFRHFGHDQVVLHERDIRKDLGDFECLRSEDRKRAFLDQLTQLIGTLDLTVFASVIRKDLLIDRYRQPGNPYAIALGSGLERIQRWLEAQDSGKTVTPVILECRGRREDAELELEFRRYCAAPRQGMPFRFEPRFVPKAANVVGLQVADLVARPIGRHVLAPDQNNRAFEVLETKLVRGPEGEVRGWGLAVFP